MSESPARSRITAAAVAWLAAAGLVAAEPQYTVEQLHALGGEGVVWFVVGVREPGEETLTQWFSTLDQVGDSPRSAAIRPQLGRIEQAALAGDALHVFYAADGVHYSYTKTADRREIRLPESAVPLAVGGDPQTRSPDLWAVVGARTAELVESAWRRQRRGASRPATGATAPPAEAAGPAGAPASEPTGDRETSYYLVCYTSIGWRPGFAAPADFAPGGRVWLCVRQGRQVLIWEAEGGAGEIRSARRVDGQWQDCRPLRLPRAAASGFAAVAGHQIVFAALVHEAAGSDQLRCWVWGMPVEGGGAEALEWHAMPSPVTQDGKPLDVAAGSAVTVYKDCLVVVRSAGDRAEVGLWSLRDGKPVRGFAPLPSRRGEARPRSDRSLIEIFILAALMGVFLLVFRRRHEVLASPMVLPAGVTAAGFAKRLAGAVVDLLPALILVAWLWREPLQEFSDELHDAWGSPEQMKSLVMPWSLFWANLTMRLVYASYCLFFELLWSYTPGKRLMGCTVVSEAMTRPSPWQIVARNATRVLELEPAMLFVLAIVFLTPHRQRVGDLLARTVVIEGEPPPEEEMMDDER